jgi:hypothetical protein
MNTDKLKEIGSMLNDADKQEQQSRKTVMSRRWFVRTLTVTATAIAAASLQKAMGQEVQPGNLKNCNVVTDNNVCTVITGNNVCSGGPAGYNVCNINMCQVSNTCGCTWPTSGNVATNSCQTNWCQPNSCAAQNSCVKSNTCNGSSPSSANSCTAGGTNTPRPDSFNYT